MAIKAVVQPPSESSVFTLLVMWLIIIGFFSFIANGVNDTYVVRPAQKDSERLAKLKEAVDGETLATDMNVALKFKGEVGLDIPFNFIVDSMKEDGCFSNAEHEQFIKIATEWQTVVLFSQFISAKPKKDKSDDSKKSDLQT